MYIYSDIYVERIFVTIYIYIHLYVYIYIQISTVSATVSILFRSLKVVAIYLWSVLPVSRERKNVAHNKQKTNRISGFWQTSLQISHEIHLVKPGEYSIIFYLFLAPLHLEYVACHGI